MCTNLGWWIENSLELAQILAEVPLSARIMLKIRAIKKRLRLLDRRASLGLARSHHEDVCRWKKKKHSGHPEAWTHHKKMPSIFRALRSCVESCGSSLSGSDVDAMYITSPNVTLKK
ncbi:unnamed protein product [Amoebophrya sp. A25]|nr:unnamed protein product [Amoebophrya sp. A25]|eukprot:GSA25T00004864001.1